MRLCLAFTLLLLGCPMQTAPSAPPAPPPNTGYQPPPPPPPPQVAPDASVPQSTANSCTVGTQCESGICEGMGCDDAHPGTCAPAQRQCTRDARAYCGCDGKTFTGSGSCAGRRYASTGPCVIP